MFRSKPDVGRRYIHCDEGICVNTCKYKTNGREMSSL